MKGSPLLAVDQALDQLMQLAAQAPLQTVEQVGLEHADGRVLARDLLARTDSPPWSNSAMDGYAFRLAEVGIGPLPVSQTIFAGAAPEPLAPGTCARIFTGAPVPLGADCVQLQENCQVDDHGCVWSTTLMRVGANIRVQGEEIGVGAPLLAAGSVLGPVTLGVLAAQGIEYVAVRRKPRVALLSTGNELAKAGAPLAPGQIHDCNRIVLKTLLGRLGCEVIDLGAVGDELPLIRTALDQAASADLIISSGGVSVGDADCIGSLLREGGEVKLWKLAIKPGKPFTFASINGVPFLGLPGNPGSALVTFLLLACPYLLRRMGVKQVEPLRVPVAAGFDWPKAGNRQEYLRVRIEQGRAVLQANQSSGTLLSAVEAHGVLEVPAGKSFRSGELLDFISFACLISPGGSH